MCPKLLRKPLPLRRHLADDHRAHPARNKALHDRQPDRPPAQHQSHTVRAHGVGPRGRHRVPGYGEGLDQRGDVEGDVGREGEDELGGDDDRVGEGAAAAGEAVEAAVFAGVFGAGVAGGAGFAVDCWLDYDLCTREGLSWSVCKMI